MKTRRGVLAISVLAVSTAAALVAVLAAAASESPDRPLSAPSMDSLSEAKIALVDGELERAEKLLRGNPSFEARTLLGRVLLERGRCDEAARLFGELAKENPKSFEAVRGLAAASQRLGRLDLAVLYWSQAAELRKSDPGVWRELGLCQREKGDAFGALSSLQQSMKLDPGQSGLARIVTELATGRRDSAHGPSVGSPGAGPEAVNPLVPRPIDPNSLVPRPRVPDPLKLIPRPGESNR